MDKKRVLIGTISRLKTSIMKDELRSIKASSHWIMILVLTCRKASTDFTMDKPMA